MGIFNERPLRVETDWVHLLHFLLNPYLTAPCPRSLIPLFSVSRLILSRSPLWLSFRETLITLWCLANDLCSFFSSCKMELVIIWVKGWMCVCTLAGGLVHLDLHCAVWVWACLTHDNAHTVCGGTDCTVHICTSEVLRMCINPLTRNYKNCKNALILYIQCVPLGGSLALSLDPMWVLNVGIKYWPMGQICPFTRIIWTPI